MSLWWLLLIVPASVGSFVAGDVWRRSRGEWMRGWREGWDGRARSDAWYDGRGRAEDERPLARLTLDRLQEEQRPWVQHNFGDRPPHVPLLGALEELGELAHAHIKAEQGIRHTPEEALAMKRDALGDVVIYLADYATSQGIDFQAALEVCWEHVRRRDWKADPLSGAAEMSS